MKRSVSVLIPNYNGRHLFEKYLEHNLNVFKHALLDYEVIVIDDASEDDSVSFLKENFFKEITLIEKTINTGFSNTCNMGIAQSSKDLIFLLNTDVKLNETYFDYLDKYFDLQDTFGVMGRVINMEDDLIQEAARCPKQTGSKIRPSNFFYVDNPDTFTPTFYLSGAIALICRQKMLQLGGFNELFNPFYCEDQELSIRAWRLGWKCYYEHKSICRHEVSGSTKDHSKKKYIKMVYFRNRYYLHYLHLEGLYLLQWHLQIIFSDLFFALFSGQFFKFQSYYELFRNLPVLKRKKKEFQNQMNKFHKKNSMIEIIHNLEFELHSQEIVMI